jgi:hypothetical protein
MPRMFNRHQALENQAFLKALRRTGNARLAARELGRHRAMFTKRRAGHPEFAAAWDAALALAHARLNQADPAARPEGSEPQVTRLANGRLQIRAPARRRLTREAEQAFLAALSATANVRLSARAAGFSHSAFYQRRDQNPAFAREMRLALELGYMRIEATLIAGFAADSHSDDCWRHNEPPPIPTMTVAQALQLLHLHFKEARLWGTRGDRWHRRGETRAQWSARAWCKWRAEKAWDREGYEVAAAGQAEPAAQSPHEPPPPVLPALDQVTGWSKASGKPPHDPTSALFGGWRLKDWEARGKG